MSTDTKPSAPVGDLIPDTAWHEEWHVDNWLHSAKQCTDHVIAREKKHHEVYSALQFSSDSCLPQPLDAGHEKTRLYLEHDEKITEFYATIATTFITMAESLTAGRTQMESIAAYAATEIAQCLSRGEDDTAQEIKENTIAEITTLGDDLEKEITTLAVKIEVPQWDD